MATAYLPTFCSGCTHFVGKVEKALMTPHLLREPDMPSDAAYILVSDSPSCIHAAACAQAFMLGKQAKEAER